MTAAVASSSAEIVFLGGVEIRPGTREVLGTAGRDVIEPKVMQVLMLLVAANGEVVTRDQLVNECWDGRAVSEDAISRVIQRLRRLSESLGAGTFVIKTVHKVGYRLLSSDIGEVIPQLTASPAPARDLGGMSRRTALVGAGALSASLGGPWLMRIAAPDRRVDGFISESEQVLRSGVPDAAAQAAVVLEKAVLLEPESALSWGRLAMARTYVAQAAPTHLVAANVTAVQNAARRAHAIDRRQIDALAALAILPPYYGDWLAAERRFNDVLGADADHLPTRDARDFMFSATGRGREGAVDRIAMAAEDKLHSGYQTMSVYAYWTLGRVDEADRAADRALQLWPKNPATWFARFNIFALTGRPERALAILGDADFRPDFPSWLVTSLQSTCVALTSRRPADIAAASAGLIAQITHDPSRSIAAVMLLSGLGQIDDAFEVADAYLLERGRLMASVRWRTGQVASNDERRRKTNMLFLPSSAPMRADPRFAVLMRRIGLEDYREKAGIRPDHLS